MINRFKKMGLMLFVLVMSMFVVPVDADEVCRVYKDYFLFNEINTYGNVKTKLDSLAEGESWKRSHVTYFPNLNQVTEATDDFNKGQVCLKNGTTVDGSCREVWELSDYYDYYKSVKEVGSVKQITTPLGDSNYTVYSSMDEDGNVISYYLHGAWYELDPDSEEDKVIMSGTTDVDYSSLSTDELIAGSFFPESSSPNLDFTHLDDYVSATVAREINKNQLDGVTPFTISWDGSERQAVLTPTVFMVTYTLCNDEPTYNAVIDYYYKGTTERVKFDNNESNPWSKGDLENGYTQNVVSPTKSNCTADQKSVDVVIDDDDFHGVVYYTCKSEEVKENPKTGGSFIAAVMVIGIAALAYVVLYVRNRTNEEV